MWKQPWKLVQNQIRGSGGREIGRFRGTADAEDTPNGSEAWVGSVVSAIGTTPEHPYFGRSEVILPDGARRYLFQVIAEAPEKVLGRAHLEKYGQDLGVLVKLLDAKDQYLLQSHPTRPAAKALWNSSYGKEESWYVLKTRADVEEPAYILLGFREGVTREDFEARYYAGDLKGMEALCHKVYVQPGDAFFVGGGVPHALGAGCFVLEVQEPSDLTAVPVPQMRLLAHRKKANPLAEFVPEDETLYERRMLGTFVYEGHSYEETLRMAKSPQGVLRCGDWGKEVLIFGTAHTKFWSYTRLDVCGKAPLIRTGDVQIALVSEGSGRLVFDGGEMQVRQGDELFFPASLGGCAAEGKLSMLLCNPGGAAYC